MSRGSSSSSSSSKKMVTWEFPHEVLEHVLVFVTNSRDRNAVSCVCKAWYRAEAESRLHVFVGNCYAVAPSVATARFTRLRCLTLKGKPRFADFQLLPPNWGAYLLPWVQALTAAGAGLEELRLKRMCVCDDSLRLVATAFSGFRSIVLTNCDGFSTDGLAAVARHCSHLEELQLQESLIDDRGGEWLKAFPDTCTSLVALNFSCLDSAVDCDVLEALVRRCSASLRSLGLNKRVPLRHLARLISAAPNLVELGTGSFARDQGMSWEQVEQLGSAFASLQHLRGLSGVWEAPEPACLAAIRPVCGGLTSLNLSYATIPSAELIELVSCCPRLQRLWLQDSIEDHGLRAVAARCGDLRELRVFPANHAGLGLVTEEGLREVAAGCPYLSSLLYFCRRMTNETLRVMAARCREITRFRVCIITPRLPDPITGEPLDAGFIAVATACRSLKRLAVSGLLTDAAFEGIAAAAAPTLETLSVAFAADGDAAMAAVLRRCEKLRKLEVRDSPFGDAALLAGVERYEGMRFLWMNGCRVSIMGCDELSKRAPRLNVELVKESEADDYTVDNVYVYRTLLPSARPDRPPSVIGIRAGEYYFATPPGLTIGDGEQEEAG